MTNKPRAVIDIGSNAIRLVVYDGAPRAPIPIYNEKARVALGQSVARSGKIDAVTMGEALTALGRFKILTDAMEIEDLRVVATAATRAATNGRVLLEKAAKLGVKIELISGQTEAQASAMGIYCDNPKATGHVADLGGGSLELAWLNNGEISEPISLPLGTIPLANRIVEGPKPLALEIAAESGGSEQYAMRTNLPLHLVGGAWRALAALHMNVSNYPLSVLSNYAMQPDAPSKLGPIIASRQAMVDSGVVPAARIDQLPAALLALEGLIRLLQPSVLIASVYGLREGLLYDRLTLAQRAEDSLLAATRYEGSRRSRFAFHGDSIAEWIAPLFGDDTPAMARLRHAVCLLADSMWDSHPEYRAEHAAELALEGNWPGVTAADRAVMAAALFSVYRAKKQGPSILSSLADRASLERARQWGLAIRLAQRIDGGTGKALGFVSLSVVNKDVSLHFDPKYRPLDTDTVRRRLKQLSDALNIDSV